MVTLRESGYCHKKVTSKGRKLRHYVNKLCLDVGFDEYITITCVTERKKKPYLNRVYAMHKKKSYYLVLPD